MKKILQIEISAFIITFSFAVSLQASQATFLKPNDRVIGIEINGVQRAYPINILNWHEIVNDQFTGISLRISFDISNRNGKITDQKRNIIPSINSFWFA